MSERSELYQKSQEESRCRYTRTADVDETKADDVAQKAVVMGSSCPRFSRFAGGLNHFGSIAKPAVAATERSVFGK